MLRPKPLACSGVKSDVQVGTSDVTSDARGAPNDVRRGAQALLRRANLQRVQQPAQLSNSTGPGKVMAVRGSAVLRVCTPGPPQMAMYLRLASPPIRCGL